MTLSDKQWKFLQMLALLFQFAKLKGYKYTGGELRRTQSEADKNAAEGDGIPNSLHLDSLAIDLNIFVDGKYRRDTEAHRECGEFWESIGGAWGGRWGDGNHYSLEHRGVK